MNGYGIPSFRRWPRRRSWIVAGGFLFALASPAIVADDTAYLTSVPTARQVVSDWQTPSERETAARASVVLDFMAGIIKNLSSGRAMTPAEASRFAELTALSSQIYDKVQSKTDPRCEGDDCPKYMLPRCQSYYMSPATYREIMDRYFTSQWLARYGKRIGGTYWQRALLMPRGTLARAGLSRDQSRVCAGENLEMGGTHARSRLPTLRLPAMGGLFRSAGGVAGSLVCLLLPVLIVLWLVRSILNMRFLVVRRSNREALEAFGKDLAEREAAILDAFDQPDFTFRYAGVNRNAGYKMRFVLLRNIKSFRRGHLEALRFAYLAFNRGLIDDERFHWFRFSAIWAGGRTDPSECEFIGWLGFLRSSRGAIDVARKCVLDYSKSNAGRDIEAQALASVQKLALQEPNDPLFRDMQRRFVDGAYWLTQGELKRSAFAPSDSPYGLTFGLLDGSETEVVYSGDGSVMTIAPPGSGKTQCNVFPNLLRWRGPAVVLDVKGEIYDRTHRWRAANVGPVIKFSPLDPMNSACFNPLTSVRQESFFLWEDSRFLASMMIVPVAKEPFWEDKAREILTAIIADTAYWNPSGDRPLSKVLSLVNRNGWTEFVERMRKNPEIATMRDEGSNLAQMEARTLDGALQTAKASLSAWVGERIAHVTRQSDWSPLDLRNGTSPTIYICVKPNEIDAYLSLLRVMIAQHIRVLTSGTVPPRDAAPILFLLDELPRLKQMPPVEEALEVGRGYGIKLWMFSQSLGQMRTAYPNADGMIGSCAVRCFMNPSLQDGTAQMLSEQIGHRKGEEHGGKERQPNAAPELVVTPAQLAGAEFNDLQIVMGVGSKPAKVRKGFAHLDPSLTEKMGVA